MSRMNEIFEKIQLECTNYCFQRRKRFFWHANVSLTLRQGIELKIGISQWSIERSQYAALTVYVANEKYAVSDVICNINEYITSNV